MFYVIDHFDMHQLKTLQFETLTNPVQNKVVLTFYVGRSPSQTGLVTCNFNHYYKLSYSFKVCFKMGSNTKYYGATKIRLKICYRNPLLRGAVYERQG